MKPLAGEAGQTKEEEMPLFEVVVVNEEAQKIVFGPRAVVAADEKVAPLKAVAESKETVDLTGASVLVRPFK